MTSTFRLLCAAMPDIAKACEQITDPHLRDRAFDVLVNAAQNNNSEPVKSKWDTATYSGGIAPESSYSTFTSSPQLPVSTYDPTSTRIDNGATRG
jgi:hypothetical protein